MDSSPVIDALQYANWSETVFREMRAGGVDVVHATIAYHEGFRGAVSNLCDWQRRFDEFSDLIAPATSVADITSARTDGKTAILFGFQTPAPIEADLDLLGVWKRLGLSFMQLTYNNQSLLASGCFEAEDSGVTRMGREAIAEMNRLGIALDMSHAGERSTLEAISLSERPVAVTHANPASWHKSPRNLSEDVISALADSGGMLGFSLYPHHLVGGSECTLAAFCEMVARTADRHGAHCLGIGSDLCQGQPDSIVAWMRNGRWSRSRPTAVFPPQPIWFRSNLDFAGIASGLGGAGFSADEVAGIMGGNWMRHLGNVLEPAP